MEQRVPPWSELSRHVLNSRLLRIVLLPPNPSLKLIPALDRDKNRGKDTDNAAVRDSDADISQRQTTAGAEGEIAEDTHRNTTEKQRETHRGMLNTTLF